MGSLWRFARTFACKDSGSAAREACRVATHTVQWLRQRPRILSSLDEALGRWCWRIPPWPPLSPELAGVGGMQVPAAVAAVARATASGLAGVASGSQVAAAAAEAANRVFGIAILFKQKRMFRGVHGTLNPSLWRWYHRHGYWATRRKHIDFGVKRRYRYHQVVGDGKRSMRYQYNFGQFWMDKSYYKPYKNYCRF
mmetsp:Transcript_91713/g.268423  ORF Transcript_91713/g.268423 Transcript_91713/m.268423 type:complete len:196 (-) Transcript_91713:131-718(-)